MSWGISSLELGEIATSGSQGIAFMQGSLSHEVLPRGAGLALVQHQHVPPHTRALSTRHHGVHAEMHPGPAPTSARLRHLSAGNLPVLGGLDPLMQELNSPTPVGGIQTKMILNC